MEVGETRRADYLGYCADTYNFRLKDSGEVLMIPKSSVIGESVLHSGKLIVKLTRMRLGAYQVAY